MKHRTWRRFQFLDGSHSSEHFCYYKARTIYRLHLFSDAVCEKSNKVLMNENVEDNWATGKLSRSLPSYKTTKEMCRLFAEGKTDTKDYAEVIQAYEADRAELLKDFRAQLNQEIEGMKTMAQMMQ